MASLLFMLSTNSASAETRYVWQESPSPGQPYNTWTNAAYVIQDAVDAALAGDEIVVTNGIYATGGRAVYGTMTNRVAVDKPLALRSVNGPEVTIIQGYQVPGTTNGDVAIRCAYLADGASLSGFTLTNGATRSGWPADEEREMSGGGVWCASTTAAVSNCVIAGNSAYSEGGGVYSGTLNTCTLSNNWADTGGGAGGSMLYNCTLSSNSARGPGGGARGGTLNTCTVTGNSARYGGGAHDAVLDNCTLTGNFAGEYGGGACESTLYSSTLSGNSAGKYGGGAANSRLNNCTLSGNSAVLWGGGAAGGILNNCTLNGNSAGYAGGASTIFVDGYDEPCTLNNCTVVGNFGGGVGGFMFDHGSGLALFFPELKNCVVYFNIGENYSMSWLDHCCTAPAPPSGVGNITNAPLFVDAAAGNYRLRPGSPCIDAGTNLSGILTNDLDNRARPVDGNGDGVAAFDIGAYEYRELRVWQDSPNPAPPYGTWPTAAHVIQDAVDVALTGDEIVVTNGVYATGGRAVGTNLLVNRVAVDKPLALRSVNGPEVTIIQGYQVPGTTNGDGAIRCVSLADGAVLSGFTLTSGATRTNGLWLDEEGGGVFCDSAGAVVSNCVLAVNAANEHGGGAYSGTLNKCTLTSNSAKHGGGVFVGTLSNCTLTGNSARGSGGGASLSTLNNSVLTGNSARYGGGADESTLNNCTLTGNSAEDGGGVFLGALNNCTLTRNIASYGGGASSGDLVIGNANVWLDNCVLRENSADVGGGAYNSYLNNCIVTGNYGSGVAGSEKAMMAGTGSWLNNCTVVGNHGYGVSALCSFHAYPVVLENCIVYDNTPNYDGFSVLMIVCCTLPQPADGLGNITNAPLFVDYAGGNLRLQSNSPCINAGLNAYAAVPTDLDGLPRIVSGTVDIGAYEYQGTGSTLSYAWLQHYGLPTDGSADATDLDADGHTTWQEWRCLTDPTNALSALRLVSASPIGTNVIVTWQSVEGLNYFLERATNVAGPPPIFRPLATDIPGQPGMTTFTDTDAAPLAPLFYRVGVEN